MVVYYILKIIKYPEDAAHRSGEISKNKIKLIN